MSITARRSRTRWTPSSVRLRLLVGLALLLVTGLITSSVIGALLLNSFLHHRFTDTLQASAQRITTALATGPQHANAEQLSALLGPPFGVLTVDSHGRALTATGTAKLAPGALARLATPATTGHVVTYEVPTGERLAAVRIASPQLVVDQADKPSFRPAALVLCINTSVDSATQHTLILRQLSVAGAALVLLLGLAVVVLRVGMRPLGRMARTADAVAAGSLAERLPVRGDRSETDQLATAVNKAFDAQARAEATARSFAADASHELRTPVSVISGWLELYRQGNLDAQGTDDAMQHIDTEAGRMRLLVEELGLLARLDAGRPVDFTPVDLLDLADGVVQDARVIYPDRSITLHASEPTPATGDAARLQQVIRNLVGNAIEHTPNSATVSLSISTHDHHVELRVTDDGPGIAATDLPRIFERFFRAEASRSRAYGGSGLGLAIVDAIVHAHHGSVDVDSTLGVGTTVTVSLPRP